MAKVNNDFSCSAVYLFGPGTFLVGLALVPGGFPSIWHVLEGSIGWRCVVGRDGKETEESISNYGADIMVME